MTRLDLATTAPPTGPRVHEPRFDGHELSPGGTDVVERYRPLCGARPLDPLFAHPYGTARAVTCKRCLRVLEARG